MSKSLFFAATMLAASPVLAAPQDEGSVKDEIQALKERLAELEQRLAEKEQEEKEKVVVVTLGQYRTSPPVGVVVCRDGGR